jgi:ribose transport system substrate-binding protein
MRFNRWKVAVIPAAVALAIAVNSSVSSASGNHSRASTASVYNASSLAAAKALLGPYLNHPSPFPATGALKRLPKKGSTYVFMDCGTPICAVFKTLLTGATKVLGVNFKVLEAGTAASTVSAAYDTAAQLKPAAILSTAIDPELWLHALKTIKAEKIPVETSGLINGQQYGLTKYPNTVVYGNPVSTLSGKIQAAYIYTLLGDKANVSYNWVPELSFELLFKNAFVAEMKSLCPSCAVRTLEIPASALGTTSSQLIVNDIQSHPSTNVVAGANSEQLVGLPEALKAAGLHVDIVGSGGTAVNFGYVKAGEEQAELAASYPVLAWMLVDAAARADAGQPVPSLESTGIPPLEIVTAKNVTAGDVSQGFVGYPNFATMFGDLWHGK